MFENTAYTEGAECPCLAGSPQAADNSEGQRLYRYLANAPAYGRYSPDYYEFQNRRYSFGSHYEDDEEDFAFQRGANYHTNYPPSDVQSGGVRVYQNQFGIYVVRPIVYQVQNHTYDRSSHFERDPWRGSFEQQQGYSRDYNGATEHEYGQGATKNSTRRKKYFKSQIIGMRDWYLVKIKMSRPPKIAAEAIIPTASGRFPNHLSTWNCNQGIYFFSAPDYFLGRRTSSYGGYLKYSLYYTSTEKTRAILDANIIIGGESGYIVHDDLAQPPPFVNWRYRVKITEENFTRIDGSAVTKKQFMKILANVTSIYIRASYRPGVFNTRLLNVSLDEIVQGNNSLGPHSPRGARVQPPRASPPVFGQPFQYLPEDPNRTPPYGNYYIPREYTAYWSTYYYTNSGILLETVDYSMTYHIEGDQGNNSMQLPYGYMPYACPNS